MITNSISGTAQILDLATLQITKSFKTTDNINPIPAPTNVYIRSDQLTAYIANSFSCNVTLVDLMQGKVIDTTKVSLMPDGLAVSKFMG